jgi:GntR family transcriptional regulator
MSRTPAYEQIIEQLQNFVLTGIMNSGDKMPSVRSLSVSLGINPNTIQKAYSELDRRGLTYSVPGKGVFVSPDAVRILQEGGRKLMTELSELVEKLALAGVSREEIIELVSKIYDK